MDPGMSEEIDQLRERISDLLWENAALKADKKRDIQESLKRETWEVLRYFFELPATAAVIASQVAFHFRFKDNEAQYYLDSLLTCGFIIRVPNPNASFRDGHPGYFYMMTPHGRGFVMANTTVRQNALPSVSVVKSRGHVLTRHSSNFIPARDPDRFRRMR
jgi:hypothetical protein